MYAGQYVFTQVMDHLPWHVFRRCVARYGGDHKIKHFSCLDQFRCFAFAQLTWRESLRDIEACLKTQSSKLYHLGFRSQRIARNTMANANAVRDCVTSVAKRTRPRGREVAQRGRGAGGAIPAWLLEEGYIAEVTSEGKHRA